VAAVSAVDPLLADFVASAGPLDPRPGEGDAFSSLARAIVFQQLAIGAAGTIHRRLVEAVGGRMTPEAVLAAPDEELRGAGLSTAKTVSLRDLASKAVDGTVRLDDLAGRDDEQIVARLIEVRGIGRWTAEMFLLFELVRPDVWPVDDLGVRRGWTLIHRLAEDIGVTQLRQEGERYRPYRSLVARYCWQAVRVDRAQRTLNREPPSVE
jgi:3-methyladenine DNA glycosylase/8-oxoguanine DNA glycosylase